MEAPVDSASADAAECEAMRSADGGSKDSPRGDAELHMQQTLLDIKRKFGRNSIIKAMDMFDDATGQQRNKQIRRSCGMSLTETHRYDDIIDLPHHQSQTHAHMSMHNRAAQFMPFAALTGYDDIIRQTAQSSDDAVERAEQAR